MSPLQGQSTYEIMELLPAGWAVAVSQSSGEPYYYNEASSESTFDWPSSVYDALEREVCHALGRTRTIRGQNMLVWSSPARSSLLTPPRLAAAADRQVAGDQ